MGKELFHRRGARVGEAVIDGLIGDGEAGIVPQSLLGQEPPEIGLAGEAAQHANEQATPQAQSGQDAGTTATNRFGGIGDKVGDGIAQEGLDVADERCGRGGTGNDRHRISPFISVERR